MGEQSESIGFAIGAFAGGLLLTILQVTIASLIGAVLLRAAAKWVAKVNIRYGRAYLTVLVANIAVALVAFVVGLCLGLAGFLESANAETVITLALLPVSFLLQALFVSKFNQLPFGKSVLITLVMFALALAIGMVLFGIGLLIGLLFVA